MKKMLLMAALALAGFGSAALVVAQGAHAYTTDQLPDLGYSVVVDNLGGGCHSWQAGYGNSARTDLGNDCDAGFQARLDDFVNATCPCAQTTTSTVAAPTSTGGAAPPPSTDPPATTPAATTTLTPPAVTVTTIVTTTDTSATDELARRIAALEQQIAALTTRVDRLAVAGDAAWLAFQQAVAGGSGPAAAAEIARGTYLNVVYGLGEFAPV